MFVVPICLDSASHPDSNTCIHKEKHIIIIVLLVVLSRNTIFLYLSIYVSDIRTISKFCNS